MPCRGFKALKQIIKIQGRLGHPNEMVEAYRQLLQHASVVTRNAAEKKINSVLDYVSAQATDSRLLQVCAVQRTGCVCVERAAPRLCTEVQAGQQACKILREHVLLHPLLGACRASPGCACAAHRRPQDFYSLTLDSMAEAKNERLWFKTNMKLANLLVGMKEGAKAAKVGPAAAGSPWRRRPPGCGAASPCALAGVPCLTGRLRRQRCRFCASCTPPARPRTGMMT